MHLLHSLCETHLDLVRRVFNPRVFNQNVNKKSSSERSCYILLGLTNLFTANVKNLSEFVKVWIQVFDFGSYLPYVFVTCMLCLYPYHGRSHEFSSVGEVSWNKSTSINISPTTPERKTPGETLGVFSGRSF